MIERLFHARRGDWALPVALSALLLAIYFVVPGAAPAWRYDRAAILDGEAWRLVTGHLLHADVHHLGWNVFGVLLVWFLFARDYTPRQWLAILLASTAVTSAGFLLLEPELEWYVGFSGVLHGCMAAGLVAWLRSTRDPLTWLVAGLFAAKLAWEHFQGALPFTAGTLSLPVVHEAHTYGAIGGVLAAFWLGRERRSRQPSL
ncbi:MAG TPA: rhombosortase [Steroidobacteraceae bacterium]|nr:rhombosortase [Steroidobacteraceae bacterium]